MRSTYRKRCTNDTERSIPENVQLVTSDVTDLLFDAVFSSMTYHEFASDAAIDKLVRVVGEGGRVAIAD